MANIPATLKRFLSSWYIIVPCRVIFWSCLSFVACGLLLLLVVNVLLDGADKVLANVHSNVVLLAVALILSGTFLLATGAAYIAATVLVCGTVAGLALAWVDAARPLPRALYVVASVVYVAAAVLVMSSAMN